MRVGAGDIVVVVVVGGIGEGRNGYGDGDGEGVLETKGWAARVRRLRNI